MNNFVNFEATYRIVTPMFLGGADQHDAELRLASFKGALRFWWRTMMWGDVENVAALWTREAELFGASNQKFGQSKVTMHIKNKKLKECEKKANWSSKKGLQYLGYGVMDHRGELSRSFIPPGSFTVGLRVGPNLTNRQITEIKNALILLGTIGGLGSKSRKGYGSLTLTKLSKRGVAVSLHEAPGKRIQKILGSLNVTNTDLPDWSAWSSNQETKSRVVFVNENRATPMGLLNSIGEEQMHFRSWGRDGRVLGKESEKNFPEDHDLSKRKKVGIKHPKRIVFGLPHNYGKKTHGKAVEPKEHERRASPLFIHIHQIDESSEPIGVLTFLPSLFLPHGEEIEAFKKPVALDRSKNFWAPVTGFLDRLEEKPEATTKNNTNLKALEVKL